MTSLSPGIHHLKARINIAAPVEVCYQAWRNYSSFPKVMSRVVRLHQYKPTEVAAITSEQEIQAKLSRLQQDILPSSMVNNWLLSGPRGKLYEIENATILEIPNCFYSTTSADPDDISIQSSMLFSPDSRNQNTHMEWEISFWVSNGSGRSTQLATDILETNDSFLEDCLQDLKTYLEDGRGPSLK